MKQRIKKLIKEIPFVKKKIHQNQLSKKFKTELDLLYNRPMEPSEEVSVIHFSVNKSATQHVKGVLRKLAVENNLIPVAIQDYAFESTMPFLDRLTHDQMEPY